MKLIYKLLLVPAFWLLLLLVVRTTSPEFYKECLAAFFVDEIKFHPVGVLEVSDIPKNLPTGNILYWLINVKNIQHSISSDSRVKEVTLNRCSWYRLDCYEIKLHTRTPLYQVISEEDEIKMLDNPIQAAAWLVDENGVFIRKISKATLDFPLVIGVSSGVLSPEVVQSRHRLAPQAIRLLSKIPGFKLQSIKFSSNEDIAVKFFDRDFTLILSLNSANLGQLREQIDRFEKIVADLAAALVMVETIDLAFDVQGVVRLKQSQ